jgi:DNA-directed RNA polymerase subunit beta
MAITFTEKKRIRKNYGIAEKTLDIPYLLELQKKSYATFLQEGNGDVERENTGLQAALTSIFPIRGTAENAFLEFVHYRTEAPEYTIEECRQRGLSYSVPVYIKLKLHLLDKEKGGKNKPIVIKETKEEEVFVGDIPKMTENGTFVVNGTERVVVSQLHRSPGVIFSHDKGKIHSSQKVLFNARIIPYRGSWLDFEFDHHDILYARIDRHRKFYVTTLLHAMGLDDEQILKTFFEFHQFKFEKKGLKVAFVAEYFKGERVDFDILVNGQTIVSQGSMINQGHIKKLAEEKVTYITVPKSYAVGRVTAKNIVDKEGEILLAANEVITEELAEKFCELGVGQVPVLYTDESSSGAYISETLRLDTSTNTSSAQIEIYRMIRPGEPPTAESAKKLFRDALFFDETRYNLSDVGRMKLNRRLRRKKDTGENVLSSEDIIDVLLEIIAIQNGKSYVDDVDTLANRRVKAVGELTANACRMGLARVERVVRERLNQAELENWMPKDLINPKPVTGAIREFFGSSQLSQFMDQVNPLSEVTHKRRISALGPGGLTRDRAGFEVRDVHPTHYGRLCPIETPEGPNIGLMNSLAIYARVNKYGFLETPYRKVKNRKVSKDIVYVSAIDEGDYHIAQANAEIKNDKLVDDILPCRFHSENLMMSADEIELMDISPKQIVSVAASLVPFLEHDDANRALMGSNMQRQAVPMLRANKPLVGTGMEHTVAVDSGTVVVANRGGEVESVDASRVVIKVNKDEIQDEDIGVDIYSLRKYSRSNQDTCINQKPIVKVGDSLKKGDVIADGSASDLGELALGQNMRVAFMPWNGYNFEDSILISEKVLRDETYTTIHIKELTCMARSTKLGDEEISADIPNLSESMLAHLDDCGIVHIGAEVKSGDILVGRVTPKGETQLSPEEKLLRAIFGEKALDVKDTSLRMPSSTEGTVVNVEIFTRQGLDKDERALSIERSELEKVRKDLDDQYAIFESNVVARVSEYIIGKKGKGGILGNKVIDASMLKELKNEEILKQRCDDKTVNHYIEQVVLQLEALKMELDGQFKNKEDKYKRGDQLSPGVLKMVKVYVAVKSCIAPGDKMAGRHGNKGVVSRICPVEDMPYDEHGRPVDVVLNPLGVPSRMNVGQILEIHLGLAAYGLGEKINKMVREQTSREMLKEFVGKIYATDKKQLKYIDKMSNRDFDELVGNLKQGVPMATPVFDGASEQQVKDLLRLADLPESGQLKLFDGQTGDVFDRPVTVGYMYMLKLNHLIDDKMHARSTGSYSLVTQQPLGGKAQFGGQRFGEMEVWALEAYGAAYTLQEMLTVKSDDLTGRTQTYKNIIDGVQKMTSQTPESLSVLVKEIRSLGLNIEMEGDNE